MRVLWKPLSHYCNGGKRWGTETKHSLWVWLKIAPRWGSFSHFLRDHSTCLPASMIVRNGTHKKCRILRKCGQSLDEQHHQQHKEEKTACEFKDCVSWTTNGIGFCVFLMPCSVCHKVRMSRRWWRFAIVSNFFFEFDCHFRERWWWCCCCFCLLKHNIRTISLGRLLFSRLWCLTVGCGELYG